MKMTRAQELYLIDLGLSVVLKRAVDQTEMPRPSRKAERASPSTNSDASAARPSWTKAQHRKFSRTMKRKRAEKKAAARNA